MASEIAASGITSGLTVVAHIRRDTDEKVWSVLNEAFEVYSDTNRDANEYDVSLTEQGTSGYFIADFPDISNAGWYNVTVYSLATGTYTFQAGSQLYWNGSQEVVDVETGILTIAEFQTFYPENESSDEKLQAQIDAATRYIQNFCHVAYSASTRTEYHSGGDTYIQLKAFPETITSVTFNWDADDSEEVDAEQFLTSETGLLYFKPAADYAYFPCGFRNIKVVYESESNTDAELKAICAELVNRLEERTDPNRGLSDHSVGSVKWKWDNAALFNAIDSGIGIEDRLTPYRIPFYV